MKHVVGRYGMINTLFFAKSSVQNILKFNEEVLVMDCTYKTVQHNED